MLEEITMNGANVTPELDANIHQYLLGEQGVFSGGNALSYEIIDNNTIRIYDGLLANHGRYVRVKPSTYIDLTINNSSPSVVRKDIIVCHYESDGVNESIDIRVVEGDSDGEAPEVIEGDLFNGDLINEVLLYKVLINGIEGVEVEDCRNIIKPIAALAEPEFAETESLGDDEIENISSGESIFSIFAKMRKWFFQIVANKTGIASLVTNLATLTTTVSGKAPTSHASTGTGYGLGNASNYGHVKVSDNYTASAGAASAGVAASSQAVYNAYATAASKSTVPTSHASAATTYGVGNASNYGHVALDDNVSANAASSGHAATPYMVRSQAISCIECTKAAMQADAAYTHPIVYSVSGVSAAQYRIDFGAVSTFLNYPTGKTILATIPMGMHNETDTSFVHPIGISSLNGNVWGAAQKNTAYTARVLVIYRTYV